ncbi:hypothetical protein ABIA33_001394 [Streptacidiphilus sp. MAP12-16]|uniref:hypothetical protein n=1 Tax=Streptacidiphilus sp. MAP12-16 TaxID=3156300 RepID=UPI0035128F4D
MSHTNHAPATDPHEGLSGIPKSLYEAVLAQPGSSAAALASAAGIGRSTAGKVLTVMESQGLIRREVGGNEDGRRQPDRWNTTGESNPTTNAREGRQGEETQPPVDQQEVTEGQPLTNTSSPDFGDDQLTGDAGPHDGPEADRLGDRASSPGSGVTAAEDDVQQPDDVAAATQPPANGFYQESDLIPDAELQSTAGDNTPAPPASAPGVAAGAVCPTCGHRTGTPGVRTVDAGARLGQGGLHQLALEHLRAHPDQEWTSTGIGKAIGRSSGAIANALATMVTRGEAELTCAAPRRYRALSQPVPTPCG